MKMSLAQRVLLSWIFALIFLIMLVLKLDSKIHWNWFLIFLPVWTFDTILILMLIVKMAGRCKPDFDPRDGEQSVKRRLWYLTALLLKLGFCLTLCSRLERLTETWISVVCVPLWVLLGGAGTQCFPLQEGLSYTRGLKLFTLKYLRRRMHP